jgi:hypothetical protein
VMTFDIKICIYICIHIISSKINYVQFEMRSYISAILRNYWEHVCMCGPSGANPISAYVCSRRNIVASNHYLYLIFPEKSTQLLINIDCIHGETLGWYWYLTFSICCQSKSDIYMGMDVNTY